MKGQAFIFHDASEDRDATVAATNLDEPLAISHDATIIPQDY